MFFFLKKPNTDIKKMIWILLLIFNYLVNSQNYCRRADGLKITGPGECLSSAKYNVENCCFECLQTNPINQSSIIKCGSLYALGYTSCTAESEAAAAKLCGAGSVVDCLCNPGSIKTEVNSGMGDFVSLPYILFLLFLFSLFIK